MEHATNTTSYSLGIDISSDKLDLALITPDAHVHTKSVRNDQSGFEALMQWLRRFTRDGSDVHACLEASGGYEEDAALFLHEHGLTVSVVNPRQIKAYGEAQLRRSKTDRADAALIARFCQREQPPLWHPLTPEQYHLRQMTRALQMLKQERDRMRNRRSRNNNDLVEQVMQTVAETLDEQIATLERQIASHIAAHPVLERQHELLCTIPGVGRLTASVVLAELGDVSRFESARQVAAYAGLVPSEHRSGRSVHRRTRLSKVGSGRLRRALYFPAITALHHNEPIKRFGEKLKERGKAKMSIVGAAMRKLLHICFGVLRSGHAFDPSLHLTT